MAELTAREEAKAEDMEDGTRGTTAVGRGGIVVARAEVARGR